MIKFILIIKTCRTVIRLVFTVYVDGSGGHNSGYGFYIKNTGESFYEKKHNITNNQAEYLAIICVLKKINTSEQLIIYSDSKNTVYQLNHEYAINNSKLRLLAKEAWVLLSKFSKIKLIWIPRNKNLAGKILGS